MALTRSQIKRIRELRSAGKTYAEIRQETGHSAPTIAKAARRLRATPVKRLAKSIDSEITLAIATLLKHGIIKL